MSKTELECLGSAVLFNPDIRGLKFGQEAELLREKVCAASEKYTCITHADDPGHFAKLLLCLLALCSLRLKCLEHPSFLPN